MDGRLARVLVAVWGVLCVLVPAAAATAPSGVRPWLIADTEHVGAIDLYVFDQPGSEVHFYERVGGRLAALGERTIGSAVDATVLERAALWRCDRRTRRFEATVVRSDGSREQARFAVRTPSCADRISVHVPRWAPPGALMPVRISDGWGLGDVAPSLCVRAPRRRHASCKRVAFAGQPSVTRHVRLLFDGRWTLSLRLGRLRVERVLQSGGRPPGAPPARPTVLVTGDSTVQGIDTLLDDRLHATATVVRAWRAGSAVAPDKWRWVPVAAAQARRYRPRVTVISIGANEGWPIRGADGTMLPCCGPDWQAAYGGRIRSMMRSYERAGRGRVLWLLLPAPQSPARQVISTAVNAAVTSAARGLTHVTLVHLERLISPGGVFHRTLRYRGRTRVVREPDGIHLTLAGAAIATDEIMRELGSMPGLLR